MRGIEQYLQVDAATLGALKYQGTWDASTNTPTLTSSVGVQGQYYVVSVAGSTNLNGETNWQVGDWAVFNGSVWQKVDGGSTGLLTTLTVTGNTYLATTSGNVGVGTSSPVNNSGYGGLTLNGASGAIISMLENGSETFRVTNATGYSFVNTTGSTPLLIGTNATERMRITSTGDVGIGTSSPGAKLHVNGDVRFGNGTALGVISYSSTDVYFANLVTGGALTWYTNGAERMRLDSAGNVGIGTSSPSQKLHVYGTDGIVYNQSTGSGATPVPGFSLSRAGASAGLASQSLQFDVGGGGGGADIYTLRESGAGGNLIFRTDNTSGTKVERMRLDSSGNLGLGVTPSAWFSGWKASEIGNAGNAVISAGVNNLGLCSNAVLDSGASWKYGANGYANFMAVGNNGGTFAWYNAPSGTAGNAISFTQAMTLDASGNVQVGTTTGSSRMTLAVPSAASVAKTVLTLTDETQASVSFILHTDLVRMATGGSDALAFETNSAERARIPAAGGMVVGTAALATTATDGFLYVPTCAGTPTGTPTTQTGTAPIVVDTTNNKLYFYSGGQWRDAGP